MSGNILYIYSRIACRNLRVFWGKLHILSHNQIAVQGTFRFIVRNIRHPICKITVIGFRNFPGTGIVQPETVLSVFTGINPITVLFRNCHCRRIFHRYCKFLSRHFVYQAGCRFSTSVAQQHHRVFSCCHFLHIHGILPYCKNILLSGCHIKFCQCSLIFPVYIQLSACKTQI